MGFVVWQSIISGISVGALYALVGIGFCIIVTVTGIINFAQGEMVMLAGMLAASFYAVGIPLPLALLFSLLITTLTGGIVQKILARSTAPLITLIILTMALGTIVKGLAFVAWSWEPKSLPPFLGTEPIQLWGGIIFPQTPWIIAVTLFLVATLFLFFNYTNLGKALRACADQPLGARLLGINVQRMSLIAFVLAAAVGAIGGIITTPLIMTSYDIGVPLTVRGLLVAILGGLNIRGTIIAGLLLGILEGLGVALIHSGLRDAIGLGALVILLTVRPAGFFGVTKAER